jgi:hypothetical protein
VRSHDTLSNDEIRMTNDETNSNDEIRNLATQPPVLRHSGFVINSSFDIRASLFAVTSSPAL